MLAASVALGLLVAGLAIPFAGVAGLTSKSISESLEDLPAELLAEPLAQQTQVVATDGTLIATWFDQNRLNVQLDQVAPIMQQAVLAIEDYRFYEHGALDLKGTLRAFVTNQANDGAVVQGGSSITQQMVKMTMLLQGTPEQKALAKEDSYQRKITELRYAIAFEQKYPKQWILERYLNIAYFGDGAWGVEAAARHYFNTTANKLTLGQSAMLAGIVKNPTQYDPTNNPEAAKTRRDIVLNRMAELQIITAKEAEEAKQADLALDVQETPNGCISAFGGKGSWFCDYVREYLLADPQLGDTVEDRTRLLDTGGLVITTTMDTRFQTAATKAVTDHVDATDNAIGGMAMVVPGTGEVRALAQSRPMGREMKKGETFLNYVVPPEYGDANGFQAGSTFKAFVLAAAVKQGIPLTTSIASPRTVTIKGDTLTDCNGEDRGWDDWDVKGGGGTYNLINGTRSSINTFYAQLEQRTGLCDPIALANEMDVRVPDTDRVGPFTLGVTSTDPLTMAGVYATFASRGVWCEPRPVATIADSAGNVLISYPDQCKRILEENQADQINEVLRGVVERGGFAAAQAFGKDAAGKTGTIQNNRAVWFNGYTPAIATAAMIAGANDKGYWVTLNGQRLGGRQVYSAFGGTVAAPMWGDAMKKIARYLPDAKFVKPKTTTSGKSVPSVAGMSVSAATAALKAAGFEVNRGGTVPGRFAKGTVAEAQPGPLAPAGSVITIYTSTGTAPVVITPPKTDDDDDKKKKKKKKTEETAATPANNGNGNGNENGNRGRDRGRR